METRILYRLLLAVILFSFGQVYSQTPTPPNGKEWVSVEVLTDEFNGNTLDSNKWDDYHPHWSGRAPSRFKKGNAFVENGYLKLRSTLMRDPSTVNNPDRDIWVNSAACVSKQKTAKPGYYYEARIKASSLSMSSAFWFRVGQYSEIDVIEHIGNASNPQSQTLGKDLAYQYHTNAFHYNGSQTIAVVRNEWVMPTRGRDEFHVYGLWWENPNSLIFYHNGVEVMRTIPPIDFEENLKMIFDTEVFPDYTASWGKTGLPKPENLNDNEKNTMFVDWIHTYKLQDVSDSAPDKVVLTNPDLEVESQLSYTFDVNYSTVSSNREVLVSFWKGETWLGAGVENVNRGQNQTQQVTINLQAIPEPDTDYIYKYHIRPRGTDYTQATDQGEVINVVVTAPLSTEEANLKTFKMYPSPASNVLNFKNIEKNLAIIIYDHTGRKLIETKALETNFSININPLQTGSYFVKIKGYTTKRLLVK